MDNHRAASWCWANSSIHAQRHAIIHIDAHYDCVVPCDLPSTSDWPCLSDLSLKEYSGSLSKAELITGDPFPVVRWDNFIEIYRQRYSGKFHEWIFATLKIDDPPMFNHEFWGNSELPTKLESLVNSELKLIIDVDLDYFENNTLGKISNAADVRASLANFLANKPETVLTIALSPECCGSW